MRQFDCPQCAAPVVFHSASAVTAVCGYCQTQVVRRDLGLESIGRVAVLPTDQTPLQPGAVVRCGSRSYRLLGRTRVGWKKEAADWSEISGSWNEWQAEAISGDALNDQPPVQDESSGHGSPANLAWIAESQGFFMIIRPTALPPSIEQESESFAIGRHVVLHQVPYTITDIKEACALSIEGSLMTETKPGDVWLMIDLTGRDGLCATLEVRTTSQGNQYAFFAGIIAAPHELEWQGLRPVPGWKGEPLVTERRQTTALSCPKCAGQLRRRAGGLTQSMTCNHCGSVLNVSAETPALVSASAKALREGSLHPPTIALGKRGHLDGIEWEVIGYVRRVMTAHSVSWEELLLFNPWSGFRWPVQSKGHWTLVDRVAQGVPGSQVNQWDAVHDAQFYRLFDTGLSVAQQVQGEFYWQVEVGEKTDHYDYIAPPLILSAERYPGLQEVTWSRGQWIEPKVVQDAFKVDKLPPPVDFHFLQPNPYAEPKRSLRVSLYWLAAAALVGIQVLSMFLHRPRPIHGEKLTYNSSGASSSVATAATPVSSSGGEPIRTVVGQTITSKSFDIPSSGPVELTTAISKSDVWVGLDTALVNETTGYRYPAALQMERYPSVDGGSLSDQATYFGIPKGRYHLEFLPSASNTLTEDAISVSLRSTQIPWSNLWLTLLAVTVYPLYTLLRSFSFEHKRWQQSDYSPTGGFKATMSDE